MGETVFKIDSVDLLPYIVERGIKWTRNDIESEDAGMMMDGTIRRDRIIMRRKIEITMSMLWLTGISRSLVSTKTIRLHSFLRW